MPVGRLTEMEGAAVTGFHRWRHGPRNLVVTGPESSGTRFVSRWLEAHPDVAARHWSMPAGEGWARHWPTDHDFDGELPTAVVMCIRSFEATIASQINRKMVASRAEAEALITQSHLRTVTWVLSHGLPLYPLVYDTVVTRPESFQDVFHWLGLEPVACPEPINDANAKWLNPLEPHLEVTDAEAG